MCVCSCTHQEISASRSAARGWCTQTRLEICNEHEDLLRTYPCPKITSTCTRTQSRKIHIPSTYKDVYQCTLGCSLYNRRDSNRQICAIAPGASSAFSFVMTIQDQNGYYRSMDFDDRLTPQRWGSMESIICCSPSRNPSDKLVFHHTTDGAAP